MSKLFSINKAVDGTWVTKEAGSNEALYVYRTFSDAVKEARTFTSKGASIIVHGAKGEIRNVIAPNKRRTFSPIKGARVKRRTNDKDVMIAIAKVLEQGDD